MLPSKFVFVSPRTTNGNQKLSGGMKRWTKLYKRSMHSSRSRVPWRKEAWRRRPRGKNYLHWCQACGKTCLVGKVWGGERGICHSIPRWWWYFSELPNRWTAQTRTLLVRTVYAMMLVGLRSLTTRWRHGLSTMLGCSMLNLAKQQAPWCTSNCCPPSHVSATRIHKALSKTKCSKAAGPSGM